MVLMAEEEIRGNVLLRRSVKQLHFGGWDEKEKAAVEIGRIASKEGRAARKALAALGVIPCLVSMLGSGDGRRRGLAVQALLELANGIYTNKAIMVEAGIMGELKHMMKSPQDQCTKRDILALLLSLALLDKTHFPIGSSSSCEIVLPCLVEILAAGPGTEEALKLTCLSALCNLSTKLDNLKPIVSSGAIPVLLTLSREKPTSERALATLANLVVTAGGKKATEEDSTAPGCFIEVMTWDDKPACRELAAFVLMVLAHGSAAQRQKMSALGIVPVLLEVALLGTPIARKRALKLLDWLKNQKRGVVRVHSGPQGVTAGCVGAALDEKETKECKRAVKKMVKQSLARSMESIMRRGGNGGEGAAATVAAAVAASHLRDLVGSSSSKSLPF